MGVPRFRLVLGAVLTAALVAPAVAQGDPTTTQVDCTPTSTLVGMGTSCSATVLPQSGGSTPVGTLQFSTDTTGGAFDPGSSCMMMLVGENGGACRLTYTPGTVGTGVHKITATFDGDDAGHDGSNGFANVHVTKHSSATSISCAPDSITLGGGTSTCVITVTDTSIVTSTPTGGVTISSASGTFGPGCEALALVSTSQASCMATYTPAGSGTNTLLGQYGGDPAHQASEGTALVGVAASPGPSRTAAVKKKCKKKGRSSSAAKKKKCKKKKRH